VSTPIRWAAGMLPGRSAANPKVDGLFRFAKMAGCPTNPGAASGRKPIEERA